ncbi:MAG: LysM peptidoglycan-binding domain-containing protein [Anaerolineae bacterium]|nr:LysM peptidoglycan-binding domain-containing protein [Anaerolineae bacterium]
MLRKIALIVIFVLMLAATAQAQSETTYTVQPGDTITGIANAFDVTVDAILIRNGLISANNIRVGQQLIIPQGAVALPTTHVVQPGESLTDIAIRYNTTVEALTTTNIITTPNNLVPGQVLTLPAMGGALPFATTHVVDTGETLRTIAAQFGTTWEILAAYNNLANPNYIQAGMVISIPPAGYVPPTTPPATGGPVVVQPTPVNITYVVQAGDTLSEIAAYFGVTVEGIRAYNAITNNRLIYPGDVLIIPPTGGPVVVQPQPTYPRTTYYGYYTVRAGDTMFAIAAWFGVNVYDLAEVNGILNLNAIYIGQALRIPGY